MVVKQEGPEIELQEWSCLRLRTRAGEVEEGLEERDGQGARRKHGQVDERQPPEGGEQHVQRAGVFELLSRPSAAEKSKWQERVGQTRLETACSAFQCPSSPPPTFSDKEVAMSNKELSARNSGIESIGKQHAQRAGVSELLSGPAQNIVQQNVADVHKIGKPPDSQHACSRPRLCSDQGPGRLHRADWEHCLMRKCAG